MDVGEVIVPVVLFAMVFGIVYVAVAARNKERLALIEKGADASIFKKERTRGSGRWILVVGIVAIGIALGILAGSGLEALGMNDDTAFPAAIFLFGGGAMTFAYFVARKLNGNK